MQQYTNGFTCAMDQKKEEIVLNFLQQIPMIGEDGKVENMQVEEVVKLVMGKALAQNLLDTLTEMLTEDEN